MRSAQKSNRSRGRGNRKSNGNAANRVYDSAGPEGKVRGTPQQIIDKYLTLARDAQTAGDRVGAENFLQHAEHYQRILSQAMGHASENRRESQDQNDDQGQGNEQPDIAEQPQPRIDHDAANGSAAPSGDAGMAPSGDARPASSAGIDGMATIDSDGEAGDLLVIEDDPAKSQPRKRKPRQRKAPDAEQKPAVASEGNGSAEAEAAPAQE